MAAAVVLAAGAGSRFAGSGHKLLVPLRGQPVLSWAVSAALGAGLDEVIVVTGAVDVASALPPGVRVVGNPSWRQGIASSLHAGITAAGEHDAVVVGLGDQPGVTAAAWRSVAASPAAITFATYNGDRGHPVRLHRSVWPLLPVTGDEGARAVVRVRGDLVGEVACEGRPGDVDTVEDLERWS